MVDRMETMLNLKHVSSIGIEEKPEGEGYALFAYNGTEKAWIADVLVTEISYLKTPRTSIIFDMRKKHDR